MTRHHWKWLNGFWAQCSCGYTDSGYFMGGIRRRMDRHVESATRIDASVAQAEYHAARAAAALEVAKACEREVQRLRGRRNVC